MKMDRSNFGIFDMLNEQVEKVLSQSPVNIQKGQMDDYQKLIHELEVYQVELEMKNEELRNSNKELLESQKRYKEIYEFAPIGCLTIDQNGRILEANLTSALMLGLERDFLIKSNFSHFISKESQDVFYMHRKRIFETRLKQACELRLVKKDGTTFYTQLESIAFKDSDGDYKQFRTAFIDITERKNAEEKLKERTHGLIGRNKKLNCLYNISNIAEKPGISLEEIIQRIVNIIPYSWPYSWQHSEVTCSRVILESREWSTVNFQETPWKQTRDIIVDGNRIGVLEVFYLEEKPEGDDTPFLKEERNLINAIAERLGRIIEYKKAEKALQDSEAKFRALSENSPNMIFILKNSRIAYVNKKCEEIMGYRIKEFNSPSFDFFTLYLPEFRDIMKANFDKLLKGEEIPQCVYTIITNRRGKRIKAILSAKLISYGGEKAILGIITNITKLKEAEEILNQDRGIFERFAKEKTEELLRAQEKLQNAKRLSDIGTLAATVAHELRNPLAVILAATYNIRRKNRNPSLNKHFHNIRKCISESNQIIDNLLFYSRIKIPKYKKINIYNILDECIILEKERYSLDNFLIQKDIKLLKDIYIEADRLQIKELFMNILNNAYDALVENGGGNEGRIEIVGSYNGDDFIKVCFKDNGSGISQEDLKRVYEPFFSKKSKGTGLGLTVCNQIVSLHDGKMEIESKKGEGTTITVCLPVEREK